ncbi:MAG TPA: DUF1990 domain-containing protein [Saprospirales bacterium]|nr:DUF1990 domain-containing protein [Saprospirales bacterium]
MFYPPNTHTLQAFLQKESTLPYSYIQVGQTRLVDKVSGFDNDYNVQVLGQGEAVWEAARQAIRAWQMFPEDWTRIYPQPAPIQENVVVVMQARVLGWWWINSCRIVYTIDTENSFGFAYGTLPGHVEMGEELFKVEKLPDGTVHYEIKAFSRPRFWMTRLGYPLARMYQRKFVTESKAAMLAFVEAKTKNGL